MPKTTIYGRIRQDGKPEFYTGELNQMCKKHIGKRIIATFEVVENGSSDAIRRYYFGHIVPAFRKALWENGDRKTLEQTEEYMREISPIMQDETPDIKTGKYHSRVRGISETTNAEMLDHISFLQQFAAENLYIYITDKEDLQK